MKPHLRLIALVGLLVPRRLRADWRQEWETELRYREMRLADWNRLDWRNRLDLLRRSASAFSDAIWLQRKRLEADVFQDLRYGARMLRIHPGFTLVSVLTLALGIGANTAIFSLLDKVLIRRLPVEQPERLVTLVRHDGRPVVASYPGYAALATHASPLSAWIAFAPRPFNLSDGSASERVHGAIVSGNYFSALGVRAARGRFFLPEEDRTPGTHAVAVISDGLWRRRFGADPAIVGRSIRVNAHPFTIVGIAPPAFTGTVRGTVHDLYVPVMMAPAMPGHAGVIERRTWAWLELMGRLAPGVSRAQAQAALGPLLEDAGVGGKPPVAKADSPPRNGPLPSAIVRDGSRGSLRGVEDLALPLQLLMAAVGFVLLIACANIANLLLARALTRRKEIAIRLANGATRGRIARQLLTEGALLAAIGGAAGLFVATRIVDVLLGFQQQARFVPRTIDGTLDLRAIAFTAGVSLVTAVIFGLAPARQASRLDFLADLKDESLARATSVGWGLRHLLVAVQVALSIVVLIGAGLCLKSLRALQAVDPGFDPARVITASFDLDLNGYDRERGRQFITDLQRRAASVPGIESAALGNIVAFSDNFWISGATIEGYQQAQGERMAFDFNAVSPGYFHTLGLPLAAGREFTEADTKDKPEVVIVNEALARRYWPGQNAVGRRINRGRFAEVIGVVRDSRAKRIDEEARPTIYLPLLQNYQANLTLHVRSTGDPRAVAGAVREAIRAVDPALPLYNVTTLEAQKDGSLYAERMSASLLTMLGLLALALAAVGLYGMMSYAVTERTREIGIRLALGAQRRDLLKLVVGRGMLPAAIGSVAGLGAALGLVRLIRGLLFGVAPTDFQTFAAVPLVLGAVALLACWLPARRATAMSPLSAMRNR